MISKKSQELRLILDFKGHQLIEKLDWRMRSNERVNIDVYKSGHDEFAVESVHETTVTWNSISEVLDLKSSLESASKEAAKWTNS